jgi:hypothetical protein
MNKSILYDPEAKKIDRLIVCDYLEEKGDPSANPWRWIINNDKQPKNKGGWTDEMTLSYSDVDPRHCIPSNVWEITYRIYAKDKLGPYDRLVQALIELEAKGRAPWNTQTGPVEV